MIIMLQERALAFYAFTQITPFGYNVFMSSLRHKGKYRHVFVSLVR